MAAHPLLLLLLLLVQLQSSMAASKNSSTSTTRHAGLQLQCLPHQAAVLLQVKRSFSLSSNDPSMTLLPSWRAGEDCCRHWDGVTCDSAGRVTALSLSGRGLAGDVPIHVAELVDLVSLDLSFNDGLRIHEPSFQTIVANLSKLGELHLDRVKVSSCSAAECFGALAKSTPRLEILAMPSCDLFGPIENDDDSLSGLALLTVVDLSYNPIIYPPGFFSHLHSLRVLRLGSSNLGAFPLDILHLRNLRVLDLWSANISGCIPHSIGNLTFLTELDLSDNALSGDLPSTVSNWHH
jgi:Leucine-rich repeat (LRR) protein